MDGKVIGWLKENKGGMARERGFLLLEMLIEYFQ